MKFRSVSAFILTAALLVSSSTVFAEPQEQTQIQKDWYYWSGEKKFGDYPPPTVVHDDGRGYVGTLYRQSARQGTAAECPWTYCWIGQYTGNLYYQY
ncbi:hypothetical protein AMS62_11425 [Bacillus sp. FJAT-18019]|nr:hypothetical protein AMS62_11425 [Bacillus sp. FJAT-18019]